MLTHLHSLFEQLSGASWLFNLVVLSVLPGLLSWQQRVSPVARRRWVMAALLTIAVVAAAAGYGMSQGCGWSAVQGLAMLGCAVAVLGLPVGASALLVLAIQIVLKLRGDGSR